MLLFLNLLDSVDAGVVREIFSRWWKDIAVLTSNHNCCYTKQLILFKFHLTSFSVSVNQIHRNEKSFWYKLEFAMDFY